MRPRKPGRQLPGQLRPQIDDTSPTQIESHEVVQQNESAAQIEVAQLLQPDTSAAPVLHSRCEQVGGGGVPHVVLLPKVAPFGVPRPVGPSQPVVALHSAEVQLPFEPLVTSNSSQGCAYA